MFLSSWLSWTSSPSHARRARHCNAAARPKTARLFLEPLEARALLSADTVRFFELGHVKFIKDSYAYGGQTELPALLSTYTPNSVAAIIGNITAVGGANPLTLAGMATFQHGFTDGTKVTGAGGGGGSGKASLQ